MTPRYATVTRCSLALLAAVTAVGAGCASKDGSGGMFASSEPKLPPLKGSEAIDRNAYGKLGYALSWSSFAAFDEVNKGRPHKAAVLGNLLVVSDDTTATSALSVTSGNLKWALQIEDRAGQFTGLFRLGDSIYASNASEMFRINAETGQMSDRQMFDKLASTTPIVLGSLVVFGSGDLVVAHEMNVRAQAWAYRFPAPIKVDPVYVGGTSACFVSSDGTLAILDCNNGTMSGTGKMYGNAGAKPAVGDGAAFVASVDQSIWAFNLADGSRRWQVRTETPLSSTPMYANGHVFVAVPGAGLVSLSSKTGNQEWVSKTLKGEMVAVRKGNPIFFDKATGVATMIDPARGDVIEQVTLPNVAMIVCGGSIADGDLYTISPRGEVSKFVTR